MKVLIVRHGAAGDPEAWTQSGRSDDILPLTEEGKAKCRGTFSAIKAYLETLDAVAVNASSMTSSAWSSTSSGIFSGGAIRTSVSE